LCRAHNYFLSDLNRYYLRARHYDPGLGRFLSVDPLSQRYFQAALRIRNLLPGPRTFLPLARELAALRITLAALYLDIANDFSRADSLYPGYFAAFSLPVLRPYAYVNNNPLDMVDPSGFGIVDCPKAIKELEDAVNRFEEKLRTNAGFGGGDAGHIKAKQGYFNQVKQRYERVIKHCAIPAAKCIIERADELIKQASDQFQQLTDALRSREFLKAAALTLALLATLALILAILAALASCVVLAAA
jgi:hypothetical protein